MRSDVAERNAADRNAADRNAADRNAAAGNAADVARDGIVPGTAGAAEPEGFEELRPLLRSIAYRLLGSVGDAEDVVQEAWLRYHAALERGVRPKSAKAYLSAVVTRLAIDELRSARARREVYVGEWLPEPLLTDVPGWYVADPADAVDYADTLSMAALLVLERLGPVQRAVFILHEVFGYPFDEIAGVVGTTAANCRQIARRARGHMAAATPRFEPSHDQRAALASRFFDAVTRGDVAGLAGLLAADVRLHGDGGGKAPQWARPIVGAGDVSRMIAGLGRRIARLGLRLEPREINRQPGAVIRDAGDRVVNIWSLEVPGDRIEVVRSITNPDKLRHLGPVADIWALARPSAGREAGS
ncbi:RNA polymerase sigma-70 factor [Spirillospora sp. NPDC048824]|uniref:RNA polymerase sigma-70 factor n=1 Tax=Spirillospora sp. NPDC048824 TaxID=3364526 RepID=UPI003715C32D